MALKAFFEDGAGRLRHLRRTCRAAGARQMPRIDAAGRAPRTAFARVNASSEPFRSMFTRIPPTPAAPDASGFDPAGANVTKSKSSQRPRTDGPEASGSNRDAPASPLRATLGAQPAVATLRPGTLSRVASPMMRGTTSFHSRGFSGVPRPRDGTHEFWDSKVTNRSDLLASVREYAKKEDALVPSLNTEGFNRYNRAAGKILKQLTVNDLFTLESTPRYIIGSMWKECFKKDPPFLIQATGQFDAEHAALRIEQATTFAAEAARLLSGVSLQKLSLAEKQTLVEKVVDAARRAYDVTGTRDSIRTEPRHPSTAPFQWTSFGSMVRRASWVTRPNGTSRSTWGGLPNSAAFDKAVSNRPSAKSICRTSTTSGVT
jgi:hypothetical protein